MKTIIKTLIIAATALGLSFCADNNKGATDSNNGASDSSKTTTNAHHDNKNKKDSLTNGNKKDTEKTTEKTADYFYKADLDRYKKSIEKNKKNKTEKKCVYKYYVENEKFHNLVQQGLRKSIEKVKNADTKLKKKSSNATAKDKHAEKKLKKKPSNAPFIIEFLYPQSKAVTLKFEYSSACKAVTKQHKNVIENYKSDMKKNKVDIDFDKTKLIQRDITQTIDTVIVVPSK